MFVTFYSYKGGVGRSTALANIAGLLATDATFPQSVLLWDFDLEAPGLHRLYPPREVRKQGFVDLAYHYAQTGELADVKDFIYESEVEGIDVLPAGVVDSVYCDKLLQLNWPAFFDNDGPRGGVDFFTQISQQITELDKYDYVLIDSRTGLSDAAGICTEILPDLIVILFRLTLQNIDGLSHLVPAIKSQLARRRKRLPPIIPVASAVVPSSSDSTRMMRDRLQHVFGTETLSYISFDQDIQFGEDILCLPEHRESRWPTPPVINDYLLLCNTIRDNNPLDVRTAVGQVRHQLQIGDYASATETLQRLLEKRPRSTILWGLLRKAHALGGIDDPDYYDDLLERVLDTDPENTFALEWKANRCVQEAETADAEEIGEALKLIQKAIRHSPERHTLYRTLAALASSRGNLDLAIQATKKLREDVREHVQASIEIATYYIRRGHLYHTVALEELKSVKPRGRSRAYLLLAYLYASLGDEAHAQAALLHYKRSGPEFAEQISRAHISLLLGDRDAVVANAQDRLAKRLTHANYANWIEVLICAEAFDVAIELLENETNPRRQTRPLLDLTRYLAGRPPVPSKEDVLSAWETFDGWSFVELLLARSRVRATGPEELATRFEIIEDLIRQSDLSSLRRRVWGLDAAMPL